MMQRLRRSISSFFVAGFLALALAMPAGVALAQTAPEGGAPVSEGSVVTDTTQIAVASVSPTWRVIQLIAFVALIGSLGGMTYGIVLWRNGSQNNDVLGLERGRRIALVFGIAFILSAVLLLISFVVIRRQQQSSVRPSSISQPVGQGGLDTRDTLLLIDAIPTGAAPIRNVVTQLLFNQPIAQTAVEQNIALRRQGETVAVPGAWTVSGSRASFVPNQTCPSPNTSVRCLEANADYEVVIGLSMMSADGDAFRCPQPTSQCVFAFRTGEAVDVLAPNTRVTLPYQDAAVGQDSSVLVEAVSSDDYAVAFVDFSVNGEVIGTANVIGGQITREFRASSAWLTLGLALRSQHAITATGYDMAGLFGTSAPVSVEILPAYCFDARQNEDETGVDCGGPTCRSCEGEACTTNAQCASGLCVGGFCREYPIIEEVIDTDGSVGNLITIRGRNFGTASGEVIFLGLSAEEDNVSVTDQPCVGSWSDRQVIVRVPNGAVTGPLRLVTSETLYDTTDDDKGGRVIFEVNDRVRPGLCGVEPNPQQVGQEVTLRGSGFNTTTGDVSFGQAKAGRIGTWADTQISGVLIPSIAAGDVPVRVQVSQNNSNPVFMQITESPTLPQIDSISPDRGPVGQIFSLSGPNLSQAPLVKFFNPRTGEVVIADTRLPEACLRAFRKGEQRAFRVPRLENGVFEVFAETDAGRSNSVNFTVTTGGRLPGLCALEPDNGPLGMETVLYGEGFGVNKGLVRFHSRVDVDVISWSDGQIRVAVPPTAQTGMVQVISSTDQLSNGLSFRVGSCSPDTCGRGLECCSTGACQAAGSCSETLPACMYSWTFGTGDDLGGVPRVIEQATCKNSTQSPSPYIGTVDACLNAAVSARFTHDMKDNTLNSSAVELRRCNTGPVFDASSCDTTVSLTDFLMLNSNQPGEGFMAKPQPSFEPDTWYQATISTRVIAENGNALGQPYQWSFKTQTGTGACAVDHVEVTPATATVKKLGATQIFTGVATALNCNLLDSSAYDWGWLSADTSKALVEDSSTAQNRVTARGSTDPGPAVDIIGSIPEFSKEDKGQLRISLEPPLVVDKWPNCSTACINAALGAKFNQAMQRSSVTSTSNVQLLECRDAACTRAQAANVGVTGLEYNNTSFTLHFLPDVVAFKVATKYRAILSGLTSDSGLPLAGLNYDANGDGTIDSYSWIFSTREDSNACRIERVVIDPATAVSSIITEEFDYQSLPVAPADACSTSGQILRGDTLDWAWGVSVSKIASVTELDELPLTNFTDWSQITKSLAEGQTKIVASTQGVSGQGDFIVQCGYQTDNQCPSPATVNTHGVGTDSCCYPRPKIVGSNPRDGSQAVCTTLAVEIEFDQQMDEASVAGNVILEINNGAVPCAPETTAWTDRVKQSAHWLLSLFVDETNAQGENWCAVEATVSLSNATGVGIARVFPKTRLADDRQYRVRVLGDSNIGDNVPAGVRNIANVSFQGSNTRTFNTGKAECKLDFIQVEITPPGKPGSLDAVFCAGRNDCAGDVNATKEGNQHGYVATGRDRAGFIVPTDFTWSIESGDELIDVEPVEGAQTELTPAAQNGEASVVVIGKAQAPSTGTLSKTVDVIIFICENPWPSLESFPYKDASYNFDVFFCRDFGEPGTQDDLPPLAPEPVSETNIGTVLKESIFIIQ